MMISVNYNEGKNDEDNCLSTTLNNYRNKMN